MTIESDGAPADAVLAEIRKTRETADRLANGDYPEGADHIRAVFEETIRLYPPVPFLGRQALRDEQIRSRKIPKGSLVAVVPWLLHRHRQLWDKPDHFIPARFLPENAGARQRYACHPRVNVAVAFPHCS